MILEFGFEVQRRGFGAGVDELVEIADESSSICGLSLQLFFRCLVLMAILLKECAHLTRILDQFSYVQFGFHIQVSTIKLFFRHLDRNEILLLLLHAACVLRYAPLEKLGLVIAL